MNEIASHQSDNHLGSPPFKILGTILKMDKRGTKQMDERRRKLMTMHKASNPQHDKYDVSRKKGGRSLKILWRNQFKDSWTTLKESKKSIIVAASNRNDNIRTNRRIAKSKKQK